MDENLEAGFINAPIPGMSLTTEPGDRPWENPSQYSTVEDAIEYYTKRILKDNESHESIIEILESGLPVENAAAIMNKTAVMNGIHNLDVGFLVLPVIEELIMTVADIYEVKYISSFDEVTKSLKISPREARMAVAEVDKAAPEMPEETMPVQPKGLMAKTTTVTGE